MLKRIRELLGGRGKKRERALEPGPTRSAGTADDAPAQPRPQVHQGPHVVHRPISRVDLDPDAVKIVSRLTRFEHSAYFVGGCVRDLLLERKPKDFDIGTSATPRQIKRLFRNCRIIGRRFRLAHIYFQNGKIIEVATFRARDLTEPGDGDGDGEDLLIRDDNIFGTPEEDALRRDFTINSLFYDLNDETVLDHADGLGDLRRKLVRCIGDPETRFREDPIRCLRAIKFAARLDFEIESKTLKALEKTRDEIHKAAPPRVLEEINRFCRGGAARRSFELMRETEVLGVILPEIVASCEARPGAWELLHDLLGRMDSLRYGDRREIRTGEILATLVLPGLLSEFGWSDDGTVQTRKGLNLREIVEAALRPIALQLRVPRREQEYCRQIVTTLCRMVPAERIRRNTKRAILNRDCFVDALWMLEVQSERSGGAFAEAFEIWKKSASLEAADPVADRPAGGERRDQEGRRRRRRRPRRSRSGETAASGEQSGSEESAASSGERPAAPARAASARGARKSVKRDDLPPPWDDAYFFAALPSAPEVAKDQDPKTDRYGAAALAASIGEESAARPVEGEAAEGEAAEGAPADGAAAPDVSAEGAPKPRRKRRPRRRRRKSGPGDSQGNDEGGGETPEPAGS